MLDISAIQRATGWVIHHRALVASTNDEAARLRDAGVGPHVVVLADEQARGRGRSGHAFASPPGGLYASMLLAAAPEDLPGPLTGAIAVAAALAIEDIAQVRCGIKWPNDLWIGRKKVAGLLLEAAGPDLPVIAGLGVNLIDVPATLPATIREHTTALDLEATDAVDRARLLQALLESVDRCTADLRFPDTRRALEARWRERLLFVDEAIRFEVGDRVHRGVLRDASLEGGLLVEEEGEVIRRRPEHVRDLRPAP